jgi:ABC-type nitrate/sulfonate/bicarbonate transport system substrate-binding protein
MGEGGEMLIRLLVLLGLVVASASCSRGDEIRVAAVPQDWFNAPLILAAGGWPGKTPLKELKTFSLQSGLASKTAVASGKAEIGLASPVVLLRDPSSASKIRLVGCYMRSNAVLGVATRGNDVEQPVGYVANTISEVFLANHMISVGRGEEYFSGRFRKVALLPPNAVQALKGASDGSSTVRSISIWEPHLTRAHNDTGAKIILDPPAYTVNVCLIASRSTTAGQRDLIDHFTRDLAEASAFIASRPQEARALVERRAGLPSGSLSQVWSQVDFNFVSDRATLLRTLQGELEALQRARMLPAALDPATFL